MMHQLFFQLISLRARMIYSLDSLRDRSRAQLNFIDSWPNWIFCFIYFSSFDCVYLFGLLMQTISGLLIPKLLFGLLFYTGSNASSLGCENFFFISMISVCISLISFFSSFISLTRFCLCGKGLYLALNSFYLNAADKQQYTTTKTTLRKSNKLRGQVVRQLMAMSISWLKKNFNRVVMEGQEFVMTDCNNSIWILLFKLTIWIIIA